MLEGLVFNIQKFSTEDGPGIRTTVFFKTCTMRCVWCHNPEALRASPELVWHEPRCMRDRACLEACPRGAVLLRGDVIDIDRETCEACGTCCEVCPTGALEVIGNSTTADALLEEVRKDRVFYDASGGGVTLSGGEPLSQPGVVTSFAARCKLDGIHVALDTCGHVPWERFEQVSPFTDLVLFDLKIFDPARHREATGVDNAQLLDNARALSARGVPMWIRTPLVPGLTSDDENLRAIGTFIRDHLPSVQRWELLAYTNLGLPKYRRLGIPYRLEGTASMPRPALDRAAAVAGPFAPDVRVTGEARVRDDAGSPPPGSDLGEAP
ncbi:MAG: glycyl-radical enzyme activating protein [Myxococcota bacterium]